MKTDDMVEHLMDELERGDIIDIVYVAILEDGELEMGYTDMSEEDSQLTVSLRQELQNQLSTNKRLDS